MTSIQPKSVDWTTTEKSLELYASNKNIWLRRVVTSEGEFLEAQKVSFGMRFLHFFGLGWKLPDVVSFLSDHKNELAEHTQAGALDKLKEAVGHYNDKSFLRKKVPENVLIDILPKQVLLKQEDKIAPKTEPVHTETPLSAELAPQKLKADLVQAKELIQNSDNFSWLLSLKATTGGIPKKIDLLRDTLKTAPRPLQEPLITIKHIVKRYDQLESVSIETKAFTPIDRLRLAVYIEMSLPKITACAEAELASAGKTVPRDVMHMENEQLKDKHIVVMAKSATSKLKAAGTFKKVYSAAMVPLKRKEKPTPVVQAHIKPEEHEIKATDRELAFFKEVQNEAGFVKMHSFAVIKSKNVVKYRVVYEQFDGSVKDLRQDKPKATATYEQKLMIAQQVIQAMNTLHNKNIVHLDLKVENVLYRMQEGKPIAGVTDFGLSLRTKAKGQLDVSEHIISDGTYGTAFATAPELIGNKQNKWTTSDLQKFDTWACGMLLHELILGRTSWYDSLNDAKTFTKKLATDVSKKISNDIEKPLAALQNKQNPTREEQMKIIIFQMLRLDPKDRMSLPDALEAINTLLSPK